MLDKATAMWSSVYSYDINKSLIIRSYRYNNQSFSTTEVILEHYVIQDYSSAQGTTTVRKCTGCNLHNPNYATIESPYTIHRFTCANRYTANDVIILPSQKYTKLSPSQFKLDSSFFEILQLALYHNK